MVKRRIFQLKFSQQNNKLVNFKQKEILSENYPIINLKIYQFIII